MPHPKRKIPPLVYRPAATARFTLPALEQAISLHAVLDQRHEVYRVFASHELQTPLGRGPLTVVVDDDPDEALRQAQAAFEAFYNAAIEAEHRPTAHWLRAKG